MKPLTFCILLLATVTCGCGTTYQIGPGSDGYRNISSMQKLLGKEVNVTLLNRSEVHGTVITLDQDTLRLSGEAASVQAIPYSSIRTVTSGYVNRAVGVVSGGMVGATIGALAGVALGEPDKSTPGMHIDVSGVTGAIGGIVGAGIGSLAGFQIPPDETYVFVAVEQKSPVVHLLVDQLIEESEAYAKVRIGGQEYTLPRPPFELKKLPGAIYIGGPRASFRRIGIDVP